MSKELSYKIETLNLLNQLTLSLSNSIIINKNEDETRFVVNRFNASETISFFFNAPISDFDFDGDEIAFYNFAEFFQLISVFKDPKITQDLNKLIISKNNSKIKYVLSDSEIISKGPKGFEISEDANCEFELNAEELKNLGKMIGLVSAEKANIKVNDGKLTITLCNETHENTFDKEFTTITSDGEDFAFNIPSEIFTTIPPGNYKVMIFKDGLVMLEYKSTNVSLKLLVGEISND